jgi:hypothetical protein
VFVSLVLLVSLVAVPGVTAGSAAATTQSDTLPRTFTVSLTPDEPGEIRVELEYRVPDDVTTLTTRLPADAAVRSTDGFQRRSETTYDWSRSTDTPTITYDLPVNQTVTRNSGEGTQTTGYLYVDTGEWAIARAPRAAVTYSGTGPRPELQTDYAITGSGATSGDILYLGRFEEHQRRAAGQQFRLVVPAAADLQSPPEEILDSLSSAAQSLSLGPRDPEVVAIAAPTGNVEWGSTGLQRGESDFWVLDRRGVDTPSNVWIHEYVHTRQTYRTTEETEWTYEGMADYYAALLTYQQGRIGYDRYRRHLEAADDHQNAVLADPDTWAGTLANYDKGALVFAALDRQLRLATDRGGTLQGVVRRINNGTLEQAEFLDAVAAVGGSEQRSFAETYTETDDVPETWSRQEQRAAFGGAQSSFAYEFEPPYDRTGPYRTDSAGAAPTVVLGETLGLQVGVENTGSATGDYRATLRVDGEPVTTKTGTLGPGGREVVTFDVAFTTRGSRRVTVEGAAETVTVRAPATPRVVGLDAPRRAAPGESVRLQAAVGNPAGRPANGTVTLAIDGDPLVTRHVQLGVNETTRIPARTTLAAGEHTVTAGSRERTIEVTTVTPTTPTRSETVTGTAPPGSATGPMRGGEGGRGTSDGAGAGAGATPTGAGGPGVGVVGALAALLLGSRLTAAR